MDASTLLMLIVAAVIGFVMLQDFIAGVWQRLRGLFTSPGKYPAQAEDHRTHALDVERTRGKQLEEVVNQMNKDLRGFGGSLGAAYRREVPLHVPHAASAFLAKLCQSLDMRETDQR
jgi:hypothetical protein